MSELIKIADLLARNNELRAKLNKTPLKSWKDTRAKLAASNERLEAEVAALPTPEPATPEPATPEPQKIVKTTKKIDTSTTVTLADIARACGIDPRIARAKARRNPTALKPITAGSWEFPVSARDEIVKFLRA